MLFEVKTMQYSRETCHKLYRATGSAVCILYRYTAQAIRDLYTTHIWTSSCPQISHGFSLFYVILRRGNHSLQTSLHTYQPIIQREDRTSQLSKFKESTSHRLQCDGYLIRSLVARSGSKSLSLALKNFGVR